MQTKIVVPTIYVSIEHINLYFDQTYKIQCAFSYFMYKIDGDTPYDGFSGHLFRIFDIICFYLVVAIFDIV